MADGKYFDFSALSDPKWKTSGGSKEKVLPEKSWLPGYYSYQFDQSVNEPIQADYTFIYRVSEGIYSMTEVEVVSFNNKKFIDAFAEIKALLEALSTTSNTGDTLLNEIKSLCQSINSGVTGNGMGIAGVRDVVDSILGIVSELESGGAVDLTASVEKIKELVVFMKRLMSNKSVIKQDTTSTGFKYTQTTLDDVDGSIIYSQNVERIGDSEVRSRITNQPSNG